MKSSGRKVYQKAFYWTINFQRLKKILWTLVEQISIHAPITCSLQLQSPKQSQEKKKQTKNPANTNLHHFQMLSTNHTVFNKGLGEAYVRLLYEIQASESLVFQRAVNVQSFREADLLCAAAWRYQCRYSLECPWWCTHSHLQFKKN